MVPLDIRLLDALITAGALEGAVVGLVGQLEGWLVG